MEPITNENSKANPDHMVNEDEKLQETYLIVRSLKDSDGSQRVFI